MEDNNNDPTAQYLQSLTNEELVESFETAKTDLEEVSDEDRNSEWHEACFAAVIVYGNEVVRRGIKKGI